MLIRIVVAVLFALLPAADLRQEAFSVGDRLVLVERDPAPPIHSEPRNSMKGRLPSGSTVTVTKLDPAGGTYIEVRADDGTTGWLHPKYVARKLAATPTGSATAPASLVVGTWNLEHFHHGATRGFPELSGQIPPRTADDIRAIASTITTGIGASLLVLNEINGEERTVDGETIQRSDELDELVREMPAGWDYVIASSGAAQRVAILFDERRLRMNEAIEIDFPPQQIEGKDIFERDPLAMHVTAIAADGSAMNDFVVIGVHLASGQDKAKNHDKAMSKLRERLTALQAAGDLGGPKEHDVLIMGDLNANMFAAPAEQFFIEMDEEESDWDVLADEDYPATRLSGNPPAFHNSKIDYIIASRSRAGARRGLVGEEIVATKATVLVGLVTDGLAFRRTLSDHLPVTIRVMVGHDSDV